MKKNKNKDNITMTELLSSIQLASNFCELLDYESKIDLKKKLGEKLTDEEYFFDTYMVKPSTLYKTICKREKKE